MSHQHETSGQDETSQTMELDRTSNQTGPESDEAKLHQSLENAFEWLKYPEPRGGISYPDLEYNEWAEKRYIKAYICNPEDARRIMRDQWIAFLRQVAEVQDAKLGRVHKLQLPGGMTVEEYDFAVGRVYFAERPLREAFSPIEVYKWASMTVLAPLYRAEALKRGFRPDPAPPREEVGRDETAFEGVLRLLRPRLPWLGMPELEEEEDEILTLSNIPPLPKSVEEACQDPDVRNYVESLDEAARRWPRNDVRRSVEALDDGARGQKRKRSSR